MMISDETGVSMIKNLTAIDRMVRFRKSFYHSIDQAIARPMMPKHSYIHQKILQLETMQAKIPSILSVQKSAANSV